MKSEGEKREMEEGVRGTPSAGKARHAFDRSTEAISLFAYLDVRQQMTSCDTRDIMEASLRRYRAHVKEIPKGVAGTEEACASHLVLLFVNHPFH